MIDLHMHTNVSDGLHSPAEVVRMAKEAGLHTIAITDHDSVAGMAEAMHAGLQHEVRIIPGIEISTGANGQDIHVLGYGMNFLDEVFLHFTEQLRNVRGRRNEAMLAKLRELGYELELEDVIEAADKRKPGETIGRPHIAAALLNKGYVQSIQEAFDRLISKGAPAFVQTDRIDPFGAVDRIHEAGGVAVIAHPGIYHDDELIVQLLEYGIDGIEAWHPDHSEDDRARYAALARQAGVITTGGSDFHGIREGIVYHGALGSCKTSEEALEALLSRRRGEARPII